MFAYSVDSNTDLDRVNVGTRFHAIVSKLADLLGLFLGSFLDSGGHGVGVGVGRSLSGMSVGEEEDDTQKNGGSING